MCDRVGRKGKFPVERGGREAEIPDVDWWSRYALALVRKYGRGIPETDRQRHFCLGLGALPRSRQFPIPNPEVDQAVAFGWMATTIVDCRPRMRS